MSGEPANFSLHDAAYWDARQKPQSEQPGARATLGHVWTVPAVQEQI
jgi:hypothetical protein